MNDKFIGQDLLAHAARHRTPQEVARVQALLRRQALLRWLYWIGLAFLLAGAIALFATL